MPKHIHHREANQYALSVIHEWEAENPMPDKPLPEPQSASNHFIFKPNSFLVLETATKVSINLHVVADAHKHAYITLDLGSIRTLIEKLLEMEADMTEWHKWVSTQSQVKADYQYYMSRRGAEVERLMKDYIEGLLEETD